MKSDYKTSLQLIGRIGGGEGKASERTAPGSKLAEPQPKTFENSWETLGNATRQLRIRLASLEESNGSGDITRADFRLHALK